MENTVYVTADGKASDIDIYACAIAYAELLRLEGKNAFAVVNTNFTESIPQSLKKLNVAYLDQSKINWQTADELVIMDRSDIDSLETNIDFAKITELYDHHFGFEDHWAKILKEHSHIEQVGSCATLIWEQIAKRGYQDKISQESLTLLFAAIISNTLNFQASVTTDRDINSAKQLTQLAKLSDTFSATYFAEVTANILKTPLESMLKDVKVVTAVNTKIAIGQLELWTSNGIENQLLASCAQYLPKYDKLSYFINLAVISEGKSYIICKAPELKALLTKALNLDWGNSDITSTHKLLLRKEIIRELYKLAS